VDDLGRNLGIEQQGTIMKRLASDAAPAASTWSQPKRELTPSKPQSRPAM
jgi:hypothetical protein